MANVPNPHEQAFHRWSVPDFGNNIGNTPIPVTESSFALGPTVAAAPSGLPAAPASFRVYPTPASARSAFRPGRLPVKEDDGINARVLLKWTGIGICAGFAVLAALVLVLNFADDTKTAPARGAVVANIATPAPPPKPVQAAAAPTTPAVTEVELAPTPPPKAKKGKKKKAATAS